jgi:sec-independent protein translocase protein TatC
MADADALREAGVPSRLPAPEPSLPTTSPAPRAPVPAAAPPAEEKVMTLVDHLSELRRRIFICIAAVVLGAAVGFYFSGQLISFLKSPLPLDLNGQERVLNFLAPGEAFFIYVKIAIAVGIILGMPVILYQVWKFISPGLTPSERRMARPWVPIALVFFLIGVAVAWVVLPFALQFLVGFESKDFHFLPTAEAYFGFITTLFLAFGLTMEFPIVLVLLSKVGIVTSQRLRSSRRIVILGIAVFSAVVTPGGDLVSPTVLGTVMYALFELSIRLVAIGERQSSR